MVIKSSAALQYAQDFDHQIVAEARQGWGSAKQPLALEAVVYYRSALSDLSVELLKDLLQDAGVISNDRYVKDEHLWGHLDKDDPRVELRLYALEQVDVPFVVQVNKINLDKTQLLCYNNITK